MAAAFSGEIKFMDDYSVSADTFKLIEVDEKLLEYITDGGSLFLKGADGDDAVACSSDATYSVTLVESSNAMYVMHAPKDAKDMEGALTEGSDPAMYVIEGLVGGHYELKRIAPRLHVLKQLLQAAEYDHSAAEDAEDGDDTGAGASASDGKTGETAGYTWQYLLDTVQCSEAELRAGLNDAQALEISPGRWCTLSRSTVNSVLDAVLLQSVAFGWLLGEMRGGECAEELQSQFPTHVTRQVLAMFAVGKDIAAQREADTVALSFAKLAKAFGLRTLQGMAAQARKTAAINASGAGQAVNTNSKLVTLLGTGLAASVGEDAAVRADELLAAWADHMPEGSVTAIQDATSCVIGAAPSDSDNASAGVLSLDLLRGDILLDQTAGGAVLVRYLPRAELAPHAAQRFQQLFAIRPRWTLSDLEPYIEPLVGFGCTRDDLLLAHSRSTAQPDGSRLFSAR